MVSLMTLHLSWKKKGKERLLSLFTWQQSICLCQSVRLSVSLYSVSVCLSVCLCFLSLSVCQSLFSVSLFCLYFSCLHLSVSFMSLSFFCPCLCLSLVFLSLSVSISCLCVCLLVSLLSHTVALMCCLYVTYCLRCRSHIFVPVTTLFCPSCHYNYTEMYLLFSLSLPFTSLPKMSVVRPSMNKTRVPLISLIVLSEACFALVSYTCWTKYVLMIMM